MRGGRAAGGSFPRPPAQGLALGVGADRMFPRAGSPPKDGNGAEVKTKEEKEDASFEKPQEPRWGELLSPHVFFSMGLELRKTHQQSWTLCLLHPLEFCEKH